jgi:hypothetical protein
VHVLGESGFDRLAEPGEPISADEQDVLHAAALQLGENRQPELRARAACDPEAQNVSAAVDPDAERDVERPLGDLAAVPDAYEQRVEVHGRADWLERPRLPGAKFVHHALGRPRDELGRDIGAVQLAQMLLMSRWVIPRA